MDNLKNIDYSVFNTVEDLYRSGLITERKAEGAEKINKVVNTDKLEVKYADLKAKPTCVFKHILVFTNDRSDNNKTLNNIREAIKVLSDPPELHVFVAADMDAKEDESEILIKDDDEEFTVSKESNLDTLVFSRLGVQDEDECEHVVQLLQDRGFLVLNPVKYSALACDKYQSACLFEKGEIPQPRFCLMDKTTLYDEDSFKEQITRVYPDYDFKDPDKNEDKSVVAKILDGHGGTGVFLCDCKKLIAILQTIFAVDPERRLIIQKKEEADGGDIRVHVLTLRNKQVILAAMKRVKLGGDFRSNVSLGAEAEPVKLTPEQEQIALKTAMVSKLPWCAVDIMPLVKGSNKEIGDNVVLEINASPGTAGISDVIKTNFINVMLNELNDPSEFMLQDKVAGYIEAVTLNFDAKFSMEVLAKLDTGNSTSASTLEVGDYVEDGDSITFTLKGHKMTFKKEREIRAVAGEEVYPRPVITIPGMTLGLRKVKNVPIAVVKSRATKTTNLLLNRDVLGMFGYVVHPSNTHVLTPEIQKVNII